jgi:hypothetical protein
MVVLCSPFTLNYRVCEEVELKQPQELDMQLGRKFGSVWRTVPNLCVPLS